MAPPGGLVWTSRFFVRHSSEYTNKLVHTQRTSVDDIWCWFWKRVVLLHCIKTTSNGTEGQSRCHEVDYFTFSLFNSVLSFILPSCIRYMKIWHWIRIFSLKPMHTHLIRIISCKLHFFISSQFLTYIFSLFQFSLLLLQRARPKPHFSQASFLAFVKSREARGLGDSSCQRRVLARSPTVRGRGDWVEMSLSLGAAGLTQPYNKSKNIFFLVK